MIYFYISIISVYISSYFIVSTMKPKDNFTGITYLFLVVFAQIILTFEVLSLFSAISQPGVLGLNLAFIIISLLSWNRCKRPLWKFKQSGVIHRIINSLKLDKSLMVLFFGYCVFILSAIFLCIVMPVNNADALGYHISRCLFWISQGNLNHFITADIRNTALPINSEILYSWVILFTKNSIGIGFIAFFAYLLSMMNIFNVLGLIGYCVRKRLWVIFILSSFTSILIQASTTETDVIIAWLVTSSLILFWKSIKSNEKMPIYMASLAFAIAIGTKPTSIMMIPAVGIFFIFLSARYKNYKNILLFFAFGFLNFVVFSSYNYILNFIDFSNLMGLQSFISINKNYYGLKGALSNFIKHLFMFINFSGLTWGIYLEPFINIVRQQILTFFHVANLADSFYSAPAVATSVVNFLDSTAAAGVLGFLVYIPCVCKSLFSFKPLYKKSFYLALFGSLFFLNLFVISYLVNYSVFDCRYLVAFIIFSAPVIVYSYGIKFKPLRYLVIILSLVSLVFVSTHIKSRPLFKVIEILNNTHSLEELSNTAVCKHNSYCTIKDRIKETFLPNTKVLVFANYSENIYTIKSLDFDGYDIDFRLLEDSADINFSKYHLIIIKNNNQKSYFIKTATPSSDITCKYSTPDVIYDKNPVFTACHMSKSFLNKNHFLLNFYVEQQRGKETDMYNVYVNQDNPPTQKQY